MFSRLLNYLTGRSHSVKPRRDVSKRTQRIVTPTNAAEFLQLKFITSTLSFNQREGRYYRTELRKDEASGLKWKWTFPLHTPTGTPS
jgi:hypothetical protein